MSEQIEEQNAQETEVRDDELATLPAERLAAMLRDKRKAEATVRGKLRDAEAERERLSGTVSGFQQQALKAHAEKAGVVPSALADLGAHVPLESVLGEDGLLDAEKATAALDALKLSRPHFFPAVPGSSGAEFTFTGEPSRTPSWSDVL